MIDTRSVPNTALRFFSSSVPGNGLGAYNAEPVRILVEGGAQDGVAKGISGGRVVIMKGYNHDGKLIDGSVGKSLAYGGTGGLVIVQGNADSRACIRLSGADVVIGGEISKPLNDSLGFIGARANVKGFLCEYMTAGRVIVLGDPGPWICAGMTGGVLYLRLQPHLNFDQAAIQRQTGEGSKSGRAGSWRERSEKPARSTDDLCRRVETKPSSGRSAESPQPAGGLEEYICPRRAAGSTGRTAVCDGIGEATILETKHSLAVGARECLQDFRGNYSSAFLFCRLSR